MNAKNAEFVNCGNDFYSGSFNEVCAKLELGLTVRVYIDCIGHTRNNLVQEIYKDKLKEKYGDRLVVESEPGGFSFSYSYCLVSAEA